MKDCLRVVSGDPIYNRRVKSTPLILGFYNLLTSSGVPIFQRVVRKGGLDEGSAVKNFIVE